MTKVLIIGRSGQLARALTRSLRAARIQHACVGSDRIDLISEPKSANFYINQSDITAVINAAAYTNVDGAETDKARAQALNSEAPGQMANACAARNIPFIHISTDYVFDGRAKKPYTCTDGITPLNTYGQSKADGELAVLHAGGQTAVLRTSWLYDGTGQNFLTAMLRLANTKDSISIVSDQIGRPTYAGHLAEACLAALGKMPNTPAVYHVTNTGNPISWADFARAIFQSSNTKCRVIDIPSEDYPAPAPRPSYSVLDTQKFERGFNHTLMPWQTGLAQALKERI